MSTRRPRAAGPCHALLVLLAACADERSPDAQVRSALESIRTAAESRDTSDVMDFVATDFRNAEGQGFEDMQRTLRGYFLAHQSIHLMTHVERLEFPVDGEARVRLSVAMTGQRTAPRGLNLSAEVRQLDLVLHLQAGRWKVVYAARQPD